MAEAPAISAAELARRLSGKLEGDGQRILRTVEPLDRAGPQALSWLAAPSYLGQLARTAAGAVLVATDCAVPAGKTVIRVADPDAALCDALRALAPPAEPLPVGVHPRAVVEPGALVAGAAIAALVYVGRGAVVGPGTQLHPGVHVGARARIGRDCVLWPNVVVRERVTIGDRVIIHPNATIGADGFGYLQRAGGHLKIPQIGSVLIEDDVEIGANSAIDRARSGLTRVGRGTKIDNLVQIGHNCDIGERCVIVGQCGISGSTTLGPRVMLAGQVGVRDHLRIGPGARVAAKSGVARDIPGQAVYRGNPATDQQRFARQQAALRRLPEMVKRLRELARRVRQLESAANDTERG